jgi:molybdopterin-guanine dinucleotide biosynthesis protein A
MEFTSASLRYCFNPFEFCIESDGLADTARAADAMAEQLEEDYRVAIVKLGKSRAQLSQDHAGAFLTVHLPEDHHPLRRPLRLLDADVVIVSGPTGGKMPKVLLSPDIDNTIAGAITCLNDVAKKSSLKRAARSVSNWLEQSATRVPVYGLLIQGASRGGPGTAAQAAALLAQVCDRTFVFEEGAAVDNYPAIPRHFPDGGLIGALLSAQLEHPGAAWMVLGEECDELSARCMSFMLEHRNPFRYVTAFRSELQEKEQSLCGIWEPKSHRRLLEGLGCGIRCPEQLLAGSPHSLLKIPRA